MTTDLPVARRRRIVTWLVAGSIAGLLGVANIPVVTRQGVDFGVTPHRLPLYLKAFEFIDRHAQYRLLANDIADGATSDQERALAVYDWVARRIQPTPEGWAIVDDHILNIIIRGHGVNDQRADVFATLSTYAGVPAFWRKVKAPGTEDGAILTFVRIGDRWVVMDIANGFIFRNRRGELATAEEIAAEQVELSPAARTLMIRSTPYSLILSGLRMPPIPRPLRSELQMPWPRLWYETKRAVGLEREDGTER